MRQNETPLIRDLRKYYDRDGIKILSTKFDCEHKCKCRGGLPLTPKGATTRSQTENTFTQAKSAFVGEGYENARALGIPRLMFVTSDPGSAFYPGRSWAPCENRTPEAVRKIRSNPELKPDGTVGKAMHEIARQVLGTYNSDVASAGNTARYVANVNAAKCCRNNKANAEAGNRALFENCRAYLCGEINILAPDVVVTMGKWAKQGVEAAVEIQSQWGCEQELVLGGRRALWIPIIQRHSREERKKIAERVREFISAARNDIMPR